jgi:hypothetical protein
MTRDAASEGHPYAADVERLDELSAKVEINGDTGENHAKPVLDSGRHGLEFFRSFGPAYAAHTRSEFDFDGDFARRYDGSGDIAFGALRRDGERFASVHSGLEDVVIELRNRGASVFGSWSGGAADQAHTQFATMLSAAEDLRGQFGTLSAVVAAVAGTADRATYDKAAAVGALYTDRIGGCTAADVTFLVGLARRASSGEVTEDDLADAADLIGVQINPAVCLANPAVLPELASSVDSWLSDAFVPAYEARARVFDAACSAAEETLATAWRHLSEALSAVRADQFDAVLPEAVQHGSAPTGSATGATPPVLAAGENPPLSGNATPPDATPPDAASSDAASPGNTAPGNTAPGNTAPGNTAPGNTAPGNTAAGDTSPDGTAPGGTALGSTAAGDTSLGDTSPDGTAPGGTALGSTAAGDTSLGDTSPEGTAAGGTSPDGTAPGNTALGDSSLDGTPSGDAALGGTASGGTGVAEAGETVVDGGQSDAMAPASAPASPMPPPAAPIAPAPAGGGPAGPAFVGGAPFAPPAGGGGGDYQRRQTSHLPTSAAAFDDLEPPTHTEPTALGATDDRTRYNDDAETAWRTRSGDLDDEEQW